jgi:predicted amidophosphoribosyltransferase
MAVETMICERKHKKTDKRQANLLEPATTKTCGTEMTPVGAFGFTCASCGDTWHKCQHCGKMFKQINRHLMEFAACYDAPGNMWFRNLILTKK